MGKQKFYVVWQGKEPGIYKTWEACKEQVTGVKSAKYKSFPSLKQAQVAFEEGDIKGTNVHQRSYILESLSVDAACSGNPGDMEYRGVYTKTGEEIFHYGPIPHGTNNIGEFLAIVHGLAYLKQRNSSLPIYSDSQTAISWVKNKRANTTIDRNQDTEQIWNLIDRAHNWLDKNQYENELLKWQTEKWGEIKADFGRK